MTDAVVSRLGQVQGAGDAFALFLKTYAGEVLTAFNTNYALAGRITERNIDHGKSASFPAIGTVGSRYHTPGTEILGQVVKHNEVIVTLDPMLISDAFIANIDEAMNHYDVRSEYTRQQGVELAKQRQLNELRCVAKSARTTQALVPGQPGGAVIQNAAMATDATVLANAFRSARQVFDEKEIPVMDNSACLLPAQYYLLTQNKDLLDTRWNSPNGDFAQAELAKIANFPLVMTNWLPHADDSANDELVDKYKGDYSNVVALLFHKSAAATLKLLDLAIEHDYQVGRQGTLMLSKFALGHGALRAASAIELSK